MSTITLRGSLRGYSISRHALKRMRQRGFSARDLEYLVEQGERRELDGRQVRYSIPESPFAVLARDLVRERLAGSYALLDDRGKVVVTVCWSNGTAPSREGRDE